MTGLVVNLLGGYTVVCNETPVTQFYSDKVRALLAYLIVESQQAHSRSKLAGLLWPEYEESRARQSLRQALTQLRKVLKDKQNSPPHVLADQQTIGWNADAPYTCDVDAFTRAIDTPNGALGAVALYEGDFLNGFYLPDSDAFEEWVVVQREQLRYDALAAFEMAVAQHEHHGEFAEAERLALRWRALDPLQEEIYQALMRCAIAEGDMAQANAYFEQCAEILSTELGVSPSAETVALRDKLRQERPQTSVLHQPALPAPATPFIGREQALTDLDQLLFDPACRLLNLIGLGGVGKTRLALEVAQRQRIADAFADGVYWVALAGVDSLFPALLTALGLEMPTGTPIQPHLLTYLAERELLLVLDNLEELVDEASWLVELLEAAARVKILCTSRIRLGLQPEWIWDVNGLAVPTSLLDIETVEAYQLFIQGARRVQPTFVPQPDDQEQIARICQLVDGHPLSIALAAAWVRILSCREIRTEIADGLELLTSVESDVVERHRSVQLIVEQTWRTLNALEQQSLQRLSVFSGPFSRQAAQQVAGITAPILLQLVDRALVQRADEFFTLHPIIRHYAADRLVADAEAETAVRSAHSRYYLHFLDQQLGRPRGAEQPQAQRYVRHLLEDIHLAWRWALAHYQIEPLFQALTALHIFYEISGWYSIGATEFQQARERLATGANPLLARDEQAVDRLRAMLLTREAALRFRLGNLEQAHVMVAQAFAQLQQIGTDVETAYAHYWLGKTLHEVGQFQAAAEAFQQALHVYEQVQDQQGMAATRRELADIYYFAHGNTDAAFPLYRQSLAAARLAQDRIAEILALLNYGGALVGTGEYSQSEELLQESLRMSRELGAKRLTGVALNNLAIIAYVEDPAKARKLTEENYAIRVEIGDKLGQANCLSHMAESAGAQGEYETMQHLAEQAGCIYHAIGNHRGIVAALSNRAQAHTHQGELETAQALLQRAMKESAALGSAFVWTGAILAGIELAVAQGNVDLALSLVGYIINSDAAYSYDRERAEATLRQLCARSVGNAVALDEQDLIQQGAKASLADIQRWLALVANPEERRQLPQIASVAAVSRINAGNQ